MRTLLALAVLATALAGCASSKSQPPRTADPVQVKLELGHEQPTDAIAAADHAQRAVVVATTRAERFVLRGTVQPASSEVRLLDGATLGQSAIARRRGAGFAFTLEHLRPGVNRYLLDAMDPGRPPWRRAVRIVRDAPRAALPPTVIVPRTDVTPGEAELNLDRRRLVAVAIGRDPQGMARIRVSADLRLRCHAPDGNVADVALVHHDPPAEIGEARSVPGARRPTTLRRRSDIRAAARSACAERRAALIGLRGIVWAEATNAHALDRYSANIPVGH